MLHRPAFLEPMIEDLELSEIIESSDVAIEPIPLPDQTNAISPILYTKNYSDAMAYLRGMMHVREYSRRSLSLTKYIIDLNPAHYTVWTYRYDCLVHLADPDLFRAECSMMEEMAETTSSKNYQLWHHREIIISRVGLYGIPEEKEFLDKMMEQDAKNYHVWTYRQWLCRNIPAFCDGEIEVTTRLIHQDIYNNSAWNHRFFLSSDDDIERTFVKGIIERDPSNHSPWSYLAGKVKVLPDLVPWAEYFQDSVPALDFLTTQYLETDQLEKARQCLGRLATLDTIRVRYWEYRIGLLN